MKHNVVFDTKLMRKVRFKKSFIKKLNKMPSGSVIVFTGPERDAVSAVGTLIAGLHEQAKYHDATELVLGVLSWNNRDSGLHESFRFSMETRQVVGLGYVSVPLAMQINSDKNIRFKLWLLQAIKRRALNGKTTIFAVAEMSGTEPIAEFFGAAVMEQYGMIVKTSDVLEATDE